MKFRWIVSVLFFISTQVNGQVIVQEYIVIDTTQSNIMVREHYDTLWNTQPYQYNVILSIDTDGDSVCDYKLQSDGYMGSGGSTERLYLMACSPLYGLNSFMIDTLVIDSIHNHDENTYHVDTFNIVEKYSYGDTIFRSGPYMYGETHMINCFYQSWMLGPELSMCINDWAGGVHYVGIKTIHEGVEYLGWICLKVQNGFFVVVKESVLYDPTYGIEQNQNPEINIYPNPAGDYFVIENKSFSELRILEISGRQCLAYDLVTGYNKLDIGSLAPGIYIIRLYGNDAGASFKLVKR